MCVCARDNVRFLICLFSLLGLVPQALAGFDQTRNLNLMSAP
ncbi:MAG: hypothetical protein PV344_02550 [Anaplasma sp.]|nr:hypothetical protein [Anaplasma sp.]